MYAAGRLLLLLSKVRAEWFIYSEAGRGARMGWDGAGMVEEGRDRPTEWTKETFSLLPRLPSFYTNFD